MEVAHYYKFVVSFRYWNTDLELFRHVRHEQGYRPRVRARGFRLAGNHAVFRPVWPGRRRFCGSDVGAVLAARLYEHLPTDTVKVVLKYL